MKQLPPILWYENKTGKRWIPPRDRLDVTPPKGFIYQRSRFPLVLHESICTDKGEIGHGSSTINEELVMAMIGAKPKPGRLKLRYAMLLAGIACERCLNAMAHRAGLKWGYPKGGKQYREARTECELCK